MSGNLIIICGECGRKYKIDPDRMRKASAIIKCVSCKHSIRIVKPRINSPQPDLINIPAHAISEIEDEPIIDGEKDGPSSISATQISSKRSFTIIFALAIPLVLALAGCIIYFGFFKTP
jgi:hypothetical protein